MPKIIDLPRYLKPFAFHGLLLDLDGPEDQAIAACPFCGKERKFYIRRDTGEWCCKVCSTQGNLVTFLSQLWDISEKATTEYETLAADRGLLSPAALIAWGAAQSAIDKRWLIPGYSTPSLEERQDGKTATKVIQLYKYVTAGSSPSRLWPTAESAMGLCGVNHYFDPSKPDILVAEGPWDGMVLWEVVCSIPEMAKITNVVAVPSCSYFDPTWVYPFAGKNVTLLYDSDHPHYNEKADVVAPPGGYAGMVKASGVLRGAKKPPASVSYLHWGEGLFRDQKFEGWDSTKPSGWDIRDVLTQSDDPETRQQALHAILKRVRPVPEAWPIRKQGRDEIPCLPCRQWVVVEDAWKNAMQWIPGLRRGFACMLAVVASTDLIDDQLWMKIVGAPSCGKTTLAEAIAIAKRYVESRSTIRGFHSGYKSDKEGTEDHSLIALWKGKCLIVKDGDTLLKAPNIEQILSEARDIYDGSSRAHYRHGLNRNYEGHRGSFLLLGTESIRVIDSSALGERFIDCVVVDGIDPNLEREINLRKFRKMIRNKAVEANGALESHLDPEMREAVQLTGGYVNYLRENLSRLMEAVSVDPKLENAFHTMAAFVAHMRARPSADSKYLRRKHEEKAIREMSPRLLGQLTKLATCLCVVLNKKSLDREVLQMVAQCALDTARGRTLTVANILLRLPPQVAGRGMTAEGLAMACGKSPADKLAYLGFLQGIRVVESFSVPASVGREPRWKLAAGIGKMVETVTNLAKG